MVLPVNDSQASKDFTPGDLVERLALANQLYRDYHTRCFWHCPPDLEITAELLPMVIKGLRTHGGRRGFFLAAKLLPERATGAAREPFECR